MIDRQRGRTLRPSRVVAFIAVGLVICLCPLPTATARSFQRISGEGSSWAFNAIDAMRVNVQKFGITVDYNPSGSTAGRQDYLNGTVDFAASDIPFQFNPEDGSAPENPAPGSYAYIPVTAGGTAFMYNLKINGQRVTNLRLSAENVTKIFTGAITTWNDPAIQADNPGLVMPSRTIVPVVRSDGSGSSAQFTLWMINQYPDLWNTFCSKTDHAAHCGFTSFYPTLPGMILQTGDLGIAGYVSQSFAEGAIGYVNYSYALNSQFPVVKVLNKAGFYTEPTPQNVAVSLLQAKINNDQSDPTVYLTQQLDDVYNDTDPRNYPLSSYSYLIVPTVVAGGFNLDKGDTLRAFTYYAMCEAQKLSASLGYSPMPINLVQASFDQIRLIPANDDPRNIDIASCKNPTFSPDGTNLLADNAPQPQACDKQSTFQCPDGTAGLANVPTAISAAATLVVVVVPAGGTPTGGGDPAAPAADPAADAGTAGGSPGGAAATGGTCSGATTTTTVVGAAAPAAAGSGAAANPASSQGCDPDSGTCPAAATGNAPAAAANAPAAVGAIATTTLPPASGWNISLALKLLIVALTIALVLAPAAAWNYFSKREPA
jgi:ABC-type phosphate transport system substrate-binding protein